MVSFDLPPYLMPILQASIAFRLYVLFGPVYSQLLSFYYSLQKDVSILTFHSIRLLFSDRDSLNRICYFQSADLLPCRIRIQTNFFLLT